MLAWPHCDCPSAPPSSPTTFYKRKPELDLPNSQSSALPSTPIALFSFPALQLCGLQPTSVPEAPSCARLSCCTACVLGSSSGRPAQDIWAPWWQWGPSPGGAGLTVTAPSVPEGDVVLHSISLDTCSLTICPGSHVTLQKKQRPGLFCLGPGAWSSSKNAYLKCKMK